jgi:hypothetical protein
MTQRYRYRIFNKDNQFVANIREEELGEMRYNFRDGYHIRAYELNGDISFIRNADALDAWHAQIERNHWIKKEQRNIEFYYDGNLIGKFDIDEYLSKNVRDTTE